MVRSSALKCPGHVAQTSHEGPARRADLESLTARRVGLPPHWGVLSECAVQRVQEEMSKAQIDMVYRDFCADLLIPLNECRRKSLYLPWKCEAERWVRGSLEISMFTGTPTLLRTFQLWPFCSGSRERQGGSSSQFRPPPKLHQRNCTELGSGGFVRKLQPCIKPVPVL